MTNEEARDQIVIFMCDEQKVINDRDKQAFEMAIQALSQKPICPSAGVDCEDCPAYEPSDDWYDVPSDEMTLEQARQAVKDLRKKLTEYLEQEPSDTVSRGVFEHVMKERDIAIEQLHELGYELGQKIESCEVEAAKLQQAYNKGFDDCRQAVLEKAINVPIAQIVTEDEVICRKIVFVDDIENMPPVTPQQKYGKWIKHPEIETSTPEYLMFYECSECGDKQCFCKSDIHKKRFCSNCGADMRGEK